MLIHALDPVYVAIKASYTSIRETINLADVIHGTISGIDGVGGIETLGKYRVGLAETENINWSEVNRIICLVLGILFTDLEK